MTQGALKPKKITEIWAFVAEESDGGEGVLAGPMGSLPCVPLIGADQARVDSLRKLAREMGEIFGVPVKLVKFKGIENVEYIYQPEVKR